MTISRGSHVVTAFNLDDKENPVIDLALSDGMEIYSDALLLLTPMPPSNAPYEESDAGFAADRAVKFTPIGEPAEVRLYNNTTKKYHLYTVTAGYGEAPAESGLITRTVSFQITPKEDLGKEAHDYHLWLTAFDGRSGISFEHQNAAFKTDQKEVLHFSNKEGEYFTRMTISQDKDTAAISVTTSPNYAETVFHLTSLPPETLYFAQTLDPHSNPTTADQHPFFYKDSLFYYPEQTKTDGWKEISTLNQTGSSPKVMVPYQWQALSDHAYTDNTVYLDATYYEGANFATGRFEDMARSQAAAFWKAEGEFQITKITETRSSESCAREYVLEAVSLANGSHVDFYFVNADSGVLLLRIQATEEVAVQDGYRDLTAKVLSHLKFAG